MNNFNLCNNPNLYMAHPSFCQDEKHAVQYKPPITQTSQNDSVQINKKKEKKSFLNKFVKYLLWGTAITLSLYGTYRTVKHFCPGFFPNKKNIEDKSSNERTFLQQFNSRFGRDCTACDSKFLESQEREFVEEAFKNKRISEKEKQKFEIKIDMRKKIRDFNNANKTEIPLTPYGGVEKIVKAYDKVKDKYSEKAKFKEILKYKIQKLTEKVSLIQKREYDEDQFFEVNSKLNRTYDLINALKEIENDANSGEYSKCYYIDYTNQYMKNNAVAQTDYSIELENELCQTSIINLSKKTYEKMFNDKGDMLQQTYSDCFLVGTVNSIINNTKKRCEFYQMFSEDEKSVTFTFHDGFKVKFSKTFDGSVQLLCTNDSLIGPLGYQMFEEAYALHRLYERAKGGYEYYTDNKKVTIKEDKNIEKAIQAYAQKDNKVYSEFDHLVKQCEKYIEPKDSKRGYAEILEGGTIHEVAKALFNAETSSYYLNGYHPDGKTLSWGSSSSRKKKDEDVSELLTNMLEQGQSIVVGRDDFVVDKIEQSYSYNGQPLSNSHFFVVRYYNPKTQEVHIFESNQPKKILILPLSVFNDQFSLLYGF